MDNLLLILVSLGTGVVLRQLKGVSSQAHLGLNDFIIYVSLPAITLYYVPKLELGWQMLYPLIMPWLVLSFAWGFFTLLGRNFQWSKEIIGALTLVAGLGNISFVGYPVIEMLYGEEGLEVAIFVGQGGFLAVSIAGVLIASHYSSSKGKWKGIFQKLIEFPPFQAFLLALIVLVFDLSYPQSLASTFKSLGGTLTPLAMVSVGLQMQWQFQGVSWAKIAWGLGYKLFIGPVLILLIYWSLLSEESSLLLHVSVMEAAMPPMVTAAIIASQYKLAPTLSNMLVGLGLLLSGISLTVWHLFLEIL